jgi:O-antigen ligase
LAKFNASLTTPTVIITVLGLLVAILVGIFVALFGSAVGNHIGLLVALPAAMAIGFLFLFNRYMLLLLIMLTRASLDVILDATKFGSFGLGAILNALVIILALFALFERPNPVRKVFRQTWLIFLCIAFVSVFISPVPLAAVKSFLVLLSYASIFVVAIALIQSEEDFGRWMKVIFLSSIIPVVYAFVDIAHGGFHSHESEGFRISSTFAHPNIFAFYLVLIISLSFYFFKTKALYIPVFIRRILPMYILLLLALLVLTKTRSAWASCLLYFTLYAFLYERKYLLYIALAPIVAFMIPEVRDRFLDLGQGNEVVNYSQLNSYAWRKLIWYDGLSFMSPSHYLFGYGLEAFLERSVSFFTMSGGGKHGAHSVFVQLFFETGALGLAAYIWLHVKTAKLLVPFYKKNKLMIFTMIMFILEFAFQAYADNMLAYLSYTWYLWFVLGATYAVNYSKREKINKHEAEEQENSKSLMV